MKLLIRRDQKSGLLWRLPPNICIEIARSRETLSLEALAEVIRWVLADKEMDSLVRFLTRDRYETR